jgi:hypothetical protein
MQIHGWKEEHLKQNIKQSDIYWLAGVEKDQHLEYIREYPAFYNKLPGVNAASNKTKTAAVFQLMQNYHPDIFDFVLKTFNMPDEQALLKEFDLRVYVLVLNLGSIDGEEAHSTCIHR